MDLRHREGWGGVNRATFKRFTFQSESPGNVPGAASLIKYNFPYHEMCQLVNKCYGYKSVSHQSTPVNFRKVWLKEGAESSGSSFEDSV